MPDGSLSGARVARELDMIAAILDKALAVVSDNGPGQERHMRLAFANAEEAVIAAVPGRLA